jgi:hypothetical protein
LERCTQNEDTQKMKKRWESAYTQFELVAKSLVDPVWNVGNGESHASQPHHSAACKNPAVCMGACVKSLPHGQSVCIDAGILHTQQTPRAQAALLVHLEHLRPRTQSYSGSHDTCSACSTNAVSKKLFSSHKPETWGFPKFISHEV